MAPLRSEQLLQKMKRHDTVNPSVFSYNAVMEAWVKSTSPARHPNSRRPTKGHPSQRATPKQQPAKQRSVVQAKNTVLRLFDEMAKTLTPSSKRSTGPLAKCKAFFCEPESCTSLMKRFQVSMATRVCNCAVRKACTFSLSTWVPGCGCRSMCCGAPHSRQDS